MLTPMLPALTTVIGKAVRKAAQYRGGGSAFPGLVVEKVDPRYVRTVLAGLPYGVVIISGTNGKTTTTKMVTELLRGQGLRVFTNPTGSNFSRGVAAALLGEVDIRGRLDADIAVLELDEAHAVHFVRQVPPDYSLLLNVMRDQLDRFGEIDTTAGMLHEIGSATTKAVVLNRDDTRLGAAAYSSGFASVRTFGTSAALREQFPSDDNLRGPGVATAVTDATEDDTELVSFADRSARIRFDGAEHDVDLLLHGVYNILNATAAVALTRTILGAQLDTAAMLASLSKVTPAFGRGETVTIGGRPCQLVLVKNPAGFRLSLSSFDAAGQRTVIAINDNYADGRDMSWLWDVEFGSLRDGGVDMVTGVRAYDMALRLKYDDVGFEEIEPDLDRAVSKVLADHPGEPIRIFTTYTAMLAIRKLLERKGGQMEVKL